MYQKNILFILLSVLSIILYSCSSDNSSSSSNSSNNDTNRYYNINFIGGDGVSGSMDIISAKSGEVVHLPANTFVKEGYVFSGWSLSADGNVEYYDNSLIKLENNITLYAVWKEKDTSLYTVTYKPNGGAGTDTVHNVSGGKEYVIQSLDYVNTGFVFKGWSNTEYGQPLYHAGDKITVTENIILYAVWEKISDNEVYYTVIIDGNGGTGSVITENIKENSEYILPDNSFEKAGFVFKGWSEDINGSIIFQPNDTIIIDKDITFYAVWQKENANYTLTLDSNGADNSENLSYTVSADTFTQIPANQYVRNGYYFDGWSVVRDGDVKYLDMASLNITENVTLYAVWRPVDMKLDTYTVTFYANGGYEYMSSLTLTAGKIENLTECKYKRNGYDFAGWAIDLEGDVQYKDGAEIKIEKDISLYAVWTKKTFADNANMSKVTFNANGGNGSDIIYYIDNGQIFYLDYNTFTNQNKVFIGWSSNPSAKTAEYYDGAYIFVNNDTTYYAVWSEPENAVKVTFDLDGGEGNMPEYFYVSPGTTIYLPLLNCSRYNSEARTYSLTREDSISTISPGSAYLIDKNTTFYVIWRLVNLNIGGACVECKNTTKWVKGVNVNDDDWVEMFGLGEKYKTALWSNDSNWFDNYQGYHPMCWAAAGSNMLLWWYTQNKEYVDKYIKLKGDEYKGPAFTYYDNHHEGASDVFTNFFLAIWGDYGGNQTGSGLTWFLNGRVIPNQSEFTGGYFKDVFENKVFATISYNILRKNFNEIITEALNNDKVVGLGVTTTGPHAITVWGAVYDDAGYIKGLYTSDSANSGRTQDNRLGGLEYDNVYYDGSGRPYISNFEGSKIPINVIDTFSLGKEYWEEYFKSQNISLE